MSGWNSYSNCCCYCCCCCGCCCRHSDHVRAAGHPIQIQIHPLFDGRLPTRIWLTFSHFHQGSQETSGVSHDAAPCPPGARRRPCQIYVHGSSHRIFDSCGMDGVKWTPSISRPFLRDLATRLTPPDIFWSISAGFLFETLRHPSVSILHILD